MYRGRSCCGRLSQDRSRKHGLRYRKKPGCLGKARQAPSNVSLRLNCRLPTYSFRKGAQHTKLPCGPQHTPYFFKGMSGGSLGRTPSVRQRVAGHLPGTCRPHVSLSPVTHTLEADLSSCVQGRMATRVTLSCSEAAHEGPPLNTAASLRPSLSQDALCSAICARSSAWPVSAGCW